MEMVYKKVNELIPYINNSRTHSEEQVNQIVASINEFGFTNPILIDEKDNIIAGHGRLLASKKLKMEEVPCIVLSGLTEAQKKAYIIADNKMALNAGWDDELLKIELENLKELDFDLELTGFDVDELDDILGKNEEETEIVEDEVPEVPEEPKAKLGDIYQLGNHRLMCGSALVEEDVEKLLDNNKCELTFTDPPYQLDTQGGGILKSANSMKQIKENGVDSFDPSKLILFSDTNIYCHNKPLIKKYIELAEENNKPYDLCFYKKTNTVPNYKGHMMTDCEYIAIIGNQDPNKGLEKEEYSKCYIGQKDSDNELSYSKLVGLCAKYIKLYGKENILDLFGGSGSTLIACEQLNRKCYMMELDPHYIDVIIQRWENFTGKKAVKLN
ncbi:MAG: site-specific DNA-methyltransferase [Mollicutes bacterium]|nr:site-specific DNA-methyltransferase [Mollicutes bacterium]